MAQQLYPWTLDFETYYTDKANGQYSLTWMTCEEYVRDPRFEIIGFSLKPGDGETRWFTGDLEYCRRVLRGFDWSKIMVIGHNMSEFDSLILTEVIGVRPAAWACTLQMARALHGGKQSNSLDAMCQLYGLPAKGKQVQNYINFRRENFNPWQINDYGDYCKNDTDRCWDLFKIFTHQLPGEELWIADVCTRMFAEPKLALDNGLLRAMQTDMVNRKTELMARVADILQVNPALPQAERTAQTQSLLRKDAVLAGTLRQQYDIDPPMKPSPKRKNPDGTPLYVYAFAKTDEGMEALLEYEDESDPQGAEDIQALAAGRIGVKSTLAESRVARFVGISERGALPVPAAYGKTQTHRLAGSQKINMQNLTGMRLVNDRTKPGSIVRTPRGYERLHKYNKSTNQIMVMDGTIINLFDAAGEPQVWVGGLRDAIVAPPGKKIVVVDSSQIELRVCHLLAGQMDTIAELRAGTDVYSSFASSVYHRVITKKDKKERQHGKVGMLQLQYQAGAKSFRNAARIMGGVRLTEDDALATVQVYRSRFTEVAKFWRTCQQAIEQMARGGGRYIDQWGLCRTEHNRIVADRRLPLVYTNLRQELLEGFNGGEPEMQWVYDDKEKRRMKKIYGGSVTENLCQWIARNVVLDQTLELARMYGNYQQSSRGNGVALSVHDEVVLVVDEDDAEECLRRSLEVMSQPPAWWLDLPVAAEGGIGQRYAEAK